MVRPAGLTIFLLGVSFCLLAQQQTVPCVDPPGGLITCEKGQLATCTLVNGKVEGRCQTPPSELTGKAQLDAWVFSEVTKRSVKPADIEKPEFQEILKSGKWRTGNKVITFKLREGIGILGSDNTVGSINQLGQKNIAQLGSNNQATINPDVNPNKPIKTYDCVGTWRLVGSDNIAALHVEMDGEETRKAWADMSALNNAGKYFELLDMCRQQMKATPEWLTPYLFCGLSQLALGNKENAREMLKYYDNNTGPAYDGECKRVADYLRASLQN